MLSLLQAEYLPASGEALLLQNPIKFVRRHRLTGLKYPDTLLLSHPRLGTNGAKRDSLTVRFDSQGIPRFEAQFVAQALRDHDTAGTVQRDGI